MGFTKMLSYNSTEDCLAFLRGKKTRAARVIVDTALPNESAVELADKLMNHYRLHFVFSSWMEDAHELEKVHYTIPFGILTKTSDQALMEFSLESAFTLIELRRLLNIKNEDLGRANRIVAKQKSDLAECIESARDIHRAILPEPEGFRHHVSDFFIMNHPKSVIGGDFPWYYEIDSYHILLPK